MRRRSRRLRPSGRRGSRPDLRGTIRHALRTDGEAIHYAAVPLLAALRKQGKAPSLHRVAADAGQNSATRLTCLLALDVAVDGPRATYVTSDNAGGARMATGHLVGLGHTRIATITGPPGNQPSRDRVAVSRFSFEMGDPKHLGHVLKVVRSVEGVYDVYRVTSAS